MSLAVLASRRWTSVAVVTSFAAVWLLIILGARMAYNAYRARTDYETVGMAVRLPRPPAPPPEAFLASAATPGIVPPKPRARPRLRAPIAPQPVRRIVIGGMAPKTVPSTAAIALAAPAEPEPPPVLEVRQVPAEVNVLSAVTTLPDEPRPKKSRRFWARVGSIFKPKKTSALGE